MINNYRGAPFVLVVLLLGGGSLTTSGCHRSKGARTNDALQGVVELDDHVIGFEVAGRVVAIDVERGDHVVADQPLVRLDDALDREGRDARVAELEAARAELSLLEAGARVEDVREVDAQLRAASEQETILASQYDRQHDLVATGAIREVELDDLRSRLTNVRGQRDALDQRLRRLRRGARSQELDAARARVDAAVSALGQLDTRLSRYVLENALDGNVIDIHVHEGEYVVPGTPGATVADLDHPYVDVFVPEGEMRGISVGAAARARVDSTSKSFTGHIEHVFPKTEFTPRFLFSEDERPNLVIRVRVRIDDPEHELHAGVPAFVTIAGRGGRR